MRTRVQRFGSAGLKPLKDLCACLEAGGLGALVSKAKAFVNKLAGAL